MGSARPTDDQLRTGIDVLEWVGSMAERDEDISAEDRLILSSAALWSGSFLRGVLGLPPDDGPSAGTERTARLRRAVSSCERRHGRRR
jgi:hypothetical protein